MCGYYIINELEMELQAARTGEDAAMIRTREYLQAHREALFGKHPELRDLRIVTVQEAGDRKSVV